MADLCSVYDFWFEHPEMHFNATSDDDKIIASKFQDLHNYYSQLDLDCVKNLNYKESISYIILYDQLTRHIYRNNHDSISYYLTKIIPFVRYFYDNNKDKLTNDDFCFVLLPLRHTNNSADIFYVIRETWNRVYSGDTNLNRYLSASYSRYIKYNNDVDNLIYYQHQEVSSQQNQIPEHLNKILAESCITGNILTKSTYELFNPKYLDKSKTYIISLSGGVDSMVCSILLYIYCLDKNIKKYAVCINYNNRKDQYIEIDMIAKWLSYLDYEFHVRNIDELQRETCIDRDFYEKITRKIIIINIH